MRVGIDFDLSLLQTDMTRQGWTGPALHIDNVQFLVDTLTAPHVQFECWVQAYDDQRGQLCLDTTHILTYMDSVPEVPVDADILNMNRLVQADQGDAYPYNLLRSVLHVFTHPQTYTFLRVLFAVKDWPSMTNNFACVLPFVRDNEQVHMQMPWNGSWWESLTDRSGDIALSARGCQLFDIMSVQTLDPVFQHIVRGFCHRSVMAHAGALLQPFLTTGRRERAMADGSALSCEMIEQYNDMTYVEGAPFHLPICHMHALLKQALPRNLVQEMIQRLCGLGVDALFESTSNERVEVFKIDLMMSAIVALLMQVEGAYRSDWCGEDIGQRWDKVPMSEKNRNSPLISGDDCEGMAQSFVSFELSLEQEFLVHARNLCQQVAFSRIFLPSEHVRWKVHIARGVCLQKTSEQNHTFAVISHKIETGWRLHVIETVCSQLVLPEACTADTKTLVRNMAPDTNVVLEHFARATYQHICVLDEWLVFEYADFGSGYQLHFGAEPFTTYRQQFAISHPSSESQTFEIFLQHCTAMSSITNMHTPTSPRLLLLLTMNAYMTHHSALLRLNHNPGQRWECIGPQCPSQAVTLSLQDPEKLKVFTSGIRSDAAFTHAQLRELQVRATHDHVFFDEEQQTYYRPAQPTSYSILPKSDFSHLIDYFRFTRIFTLRFLMQEFNENTPENAAWARQYFQWHPEFDLCFDALRIATTVCFTSSFCESDNDLQEKPPVRKVNMATSKFLKEQRNELQEIARKMAKIINCNTTADLKNAPVCISCLQKCKSVHCMLRRLQTSVKTLKPHLCGFLERDVGVHATDVMAALSEIQNSDNHTFNVYSRLFRALQKLISSLNVYVVQHAQSH